MDICQPLWAFGKTLPDILYRCPWYLLTDEQIAKVVNCPENVAVTLRSINQSKGKIDPEIWFAISGNIQKHGIDGKLAMKNIKNAKAAIEKNVRLLVKG